MTLGGGQLGNKICHLYTHYGESSESLEGDHGRDRVRLFSLVTSFQEGLPMRKSAHVSCMLHASNRQ